MEDVTTMDWNDRVRRIEKHGFWLFCTKPDYCQLHRKSDKFITVNGNIHRDTRILTPEGTINWGSSSNAVRHAEGIIENEQWHDQWDEVTGEFHKAFEGVPEEEVMSDVNQTLTEIRKEKAHGK